jgi:hypothetical protein
LDGFNTQKVTIRTLRSELLLVCRSLAQNACFNTRNTGVDSAFGKKLANERSNACGWPAKRSSCRFE